LTAIRPEAEIDGNAINQSSMQGLVRALECASKAWQKPKIVLYLSGWTDRVARVGGWKKENRNLGVCDA
jgi:hypothetical protein